MDGFSVTSLTSLCDTISHAAVSTNTELSDLLRAIPNEKAQQSFTPSLRVAAKPRQRDHPAPEIIDAGFGSFRVAARSAPGVPVRLPEDPGQPQQASIAT
ncbi:hypothetical protein V2G26_015452 [Clonostachys chloroleuca]